MTGTIREFIVLASGGDCLLSVFRYFLESKGFSSRHFLELLIFVLFTRAISKMLLGVYGWVYLKEVMRRYAKNYLPILFNMYTLEDHMDDHTEKAVHLATLETIRVYVELAPPELINRYIRSAVEKARSDEKSLLKKVGVRTFGLGVCER